ncbi:MAG: DUF2852 domain-containing protein [Pseudomonadota bacterium]
MTEMVARIDDYGKGAWIALMVVAFIIAWPVGLAILFYLIWSGRMGKGCSKGRMSRAAAKWEDKMNRWGMQAKAYQPTGNAAFDEYRAETLKRLEEEASEFKSFLDRLRMAKDRQEFEDFMADRKSRGPQNGGTSSGPTGPEAPQPQG